jgi:hypothetical protein
MKILHRHDGREGKHFGQDSRVLEERLGAGIRSKVYRGSLFPYRKCGNHNE